MMTFNHRITSMHSMIFTDFYKFYEILVKEYLIIKKVFRNETIFKSKSSTIFFSSMPTFRAPYRSNIVNQIPDFSFPKIHSNLRYISFKNYFRNVGLFEKNILIHMLDLYPKQFYFLCVTVAKT